MPDISALQSAYNVLNGYSATGRETAVEASGKTFENLLSEAIHNMTGTGEDSVSFNDALLMGESDNLHDPMIAAAEAELAVSLVVQIRDRVVDAYNEVMRMQV